MIELIPQAGACLTTKNVLTRAGRVRFMWREESKHPADNGWHIISAIDTSAYLADINNWQVASFNALCNIEPALIAIYDFPVGSDLQIVDDGQRMDIVHTASGIVIPPENYYVPPQLRA